MAKSSNTIPTVPGFALFRLVKGECYLKCSKCCKAWFLGIFPPRVKPTLAPQVHYNCGIHLASHKDQAHGGVARIRRKPSAPRPVPDRAKGV